jgi:hypothetical protein
MTAEDELEGALALSDTALAEEQDPDAEYIQEHAVERGLWGEPVVEDRVERIDGVARA